MQSFSSTAEINKMTSDTSSMINLNLDWVIKYNISSSTPSRAPL